MDNKVTDSNKSINIYGTVIPVLNQRRFFSDKTDIRIQKNDNHSFTIKQLFHAVQHGYIEFLKSVPTNMWKGYLKCLDEKTCFSLLHYAVLENHIDIVIFFLEFKPNINISASNKICPIHLAAQKSHVKIVELLCSQKSILIDAADDKGQTPLHIAARRGHHEVVKVLLTYGASVHKVETDKVSVMHHPVRRNDTKMVQTLISYNASVTIKNNNGQSPLMIAAIEGHSDLLLFLLSEMKQRDCQISNVLNDKDNDGLSCLAFGVQNKNVNIIKICLDNGSDLNTKQKDGKSILHMAAINDFESLFHFIDLDKMNLNEPDNDFNTPLHYCVINNNLKFLKLLIKHGANINICNRQFQTPLLLACTEDSKSKDISEIIKFLIFYKADLRIRDIHMKTIIHHLVEKQNIDMIKYIIRTIPKNIRIQLVNSQDYLNNSPLHYSARFQDVQLSKILLDAGADPKLFAANDSLPLHVATSKGNLDVVKLLLNASVETEYYRDSNENSVIHIAANEGKYEIFKYFVENKKDYMARDEYGRNVLMFACRSGCLQIVQFLISMEMNVNLHDDMKSTALHEAAGQGHLDIVECLWNFGALFLDNVYGQSPLDVALVNKQDHIVRFFLNETNWRRVMEYRHKNGDSHIENLIKCNEECTLELLDRCITENTSNKLDPNYDAKYWFGILDAGPDDLSSINKRYYALLSMGKYKRLNLMKHPLSYKLLKRKWITYGLGFFVMDLLIYLIYISAIIYYIAINNPMTDNDIFDVNTGCKIRKLNQTRSRGSADYKILITNFLIYSILALRFVFKVLKMLGQKLRYFTNSWNYCFLYIDLSVLSFINNPLTLPCLYQWQIAPGLLLSSFYSLLFYLQYFYMIGIYVIMYQKVLKSMAKVLLTFSLIFLGFSYAFYIINSDQIPFKDPGLALIKTIGMMIGEIDLVTYFMTGKKNYFYPSLFVISMFMVVVPIAVFNLIIGLAIGDINEISSEASLEVLKLKIDYAWEVESSLPVHIQRFFYFIELHEYFRKKRDSRSVIFKIKNYFK